jgi:hypothetical protein
MSYERSVMEAFLVRLFEKAQTVEEIPRGLSRWRHA